jgi:pilus assembly protein Flp/PilA
MTGIPQQRLKLWKPTSWIFFVVNQRVTKPHDLTLTGVGHFDPAFGGHRAAASPRELLVDQSGKDSTMTKFVSRFVKDESGATAIEYGLIAALIAVVIIGAMTTLGGNLSTTFTNIAGNLGGDVGTAPAAPQD